MVRDQIQDLVSKHLGNPHLTSPLNGREAGEGEGAKSNLSGLLDDVSTMFPVPPGFRRDGLSELGEKQITEKLTDYATELYNQREQELGAKTMRLLERFVMLIGAEATVKLLNGKYDGKPTGGIDFFWIEHLTAMEHLRQGIGLRSVGQEQPLVVYKREGHALFQALLASIQYDVAHSVYHVGIAKETVQGPQKRREAVPVGKRVGRNDPCPCGSGKKYKHCCGK